MNSDNQSSPTISTSTRPDPCLSLSVLLSLSLSLYLHPHLPYLSSYLNVPPKKEEKHSIYSLNLYYHLVLRLISFLPNWKEWQLHCSCSYNYLGKEGSWSLSCQDNFNPFLYLHTYLPPSSFLFKIGGEGKKREKKREAPKSRVFFLVSFFFFVFVGKRLFLFLPPPKLDLILIMFSYIVVL